MANWVTAILLKHRTTDGLCEAHEHVPLGKQYEVDLESIEMMNLYHFGEQKHHQKEGIWTKDGTWLPTELLLIPGYEQQQS